MVKFVHTLRGLCAISIVQQWRLFQVDDIPPQFYVELVECCLRRGRISILRNMLLNNKIFLTLIDSKDLITTLHQSVQHLINTGLVSVDMEIAESLIKRGMQVASVSQLIRASEFFIECGWYRAAGRLLDHLITVMEPKSERYHVLTVLTYLISTNIADCKFSRAKDAFVRANVFYDKVKDAKFNRAPLFAEEAYRHYTVSSFSEANRWADKALTELDSTLSTPACITVLRRTSKIYINTRHFDRAESLIKHAVNLALAFYGPQHPVYADTLQDYGFCLLHLDLVKDCLVVYDKAVKITDKLFGENNIKSAVAHEDLAYASYVYDYSYGTYKRSLAHAEISNRIVKKLLAPDHLLHASTSRLRALILEELAFEKDDPEQKEKLLKEAQDLHNKSLKLCRTILGEENIQTAKHYGNLGRLFQSMGMYKAAEKMHKRAIRIKESLLGSENYELALSLGHLASLYNYDAKRYDDALPLYLRSIEIALKLFGPGFSGLEYDYRGLMHLYEATNKTEQYYKYFSLLQEWIDIREETSNRLVDDESLSTPHLRSTHEVLASVIKDIKTDT